MQYKKLRLLVPVQTTPIYSVVVGCFLRPGKLHDLNTLTDGVRFNGIMRSSLGNKIYNHSLSGNILHLSQQTVAISL